MGRPGTFNSERARAAGRTSASRYKQRMMAMSPLERLALRELRRLLRDPNVSDHVKQKAADSALKLERLVAKRSVVA